MPSKEQSSESTRKYIKEFAKDYVKPLGYLAIALLGLAFLRFL